MRVAILVKALKHRVGDRVRQSVGIRMPFGPKIGFDLHAAKYQRPARYETMNIAAKSDSIHIE